MFDRYFQLGYVVGSHGLKGELKVKLDSDDPVYYQELESIFVNQKQKLVPFFIEWFQIQPDGKALLKLEEVDSADAALALKSSELWLPDDFLPELDEGQFYFHELIGYKALNLPDQEIGTIKDFYTDGPQDLFAVQHGEKEILIPVTDEFIDKVDHDNKTIQFNLPDGLLSIYLDEN